MDKCCGPVKVQSERFKKVVLIALILNLSMFFIEVISSFLANSSSLKADALDFLGDSANYIISLYVINKASKTISTASLIKGLTMALFAIWILVDVFINLSMGTFPKAEIMGFTGAAAFAVNLSVALMLYKFRDGDSNMQSVWVCSRNDALGNIAVMLAAISVNYFSSQWPDMIVALFMASLSGVSGYKIIKLALNELKHGIKAKPQNCCG